MDDTKFWSLIALLDWSKTGNDDAVMAPLIQALTAMPEKEIFGFDDVLSEKLHALDGEKYAREIGEDALEDEEYFSPDVFLYARCAAVINGRDAFESVLSDPENMPKDTEFEAILYAAQEAYEAKTGKDYSYSPETEHETYANAEGWPDRNPDEEREE